MSAPADTAIAHFVAKWQRREPDMALAEVFCPPEQRLRFQAWGALLHELREAAFELSDAGVATAKCQWWAEELLGAGQGRSRHPVTAVLAAPGLPAAAVARALLEQLAERPRPADAADAMAQLRPFAEALSVLEGAVFSEAPGAGQPDAIAADLLLQRLPDGLGAEDQARLPLNLLARHGRTVAEVAAGQGDAVLRDWARELGTLQPGHGDTTGLYRRLRTAFNRGRLARLAAGKGFRPPLAPALVWRAWRVARGR